MDDFPVWIDGQLRSGTLVRELERVERELAELKRDTVMTGMAIERQREAAEDARFAMRMRALRHQLDVVRRTGGRVGLVYKVRENALLRR